MDGKIHGPEDPIGVAVVRTGREGSRERRGGTERGERRRLVGVATDGTTRKERREGEAR